MNSHPSNINRLLTCFFAVLLTIQALYLLAGFASIPLYYHRVTTQTIESVVLIGKVQISNELVAEMVAARGLSLPQYAAYRIVFNTLAALIPLVIAALIVRRARWQWFAWFTAFIIVFLGESALSEQTLVSQFISVKVVGANDLFWFLVLPYLFLFPNGKAVPRRAAWLVGALVIYHFFIQTGTVMAYVAPDLAMRLNLPNWGEGVYISARLAELRHHSGLPGLSLPPRLEPYRTPTNQMVSLWSWSDPCPDSHCSFSRRHGARRLSE